MPKKTATTTKPRAKRKSTAKAKAQSSTVKSETKTPKRATKPVKSRSVATPVSKNRGNVWQRTWATYLRLDAFSKLIGICFMVALCLSLPAILLALGASVMLSLRGLTGGVLLFLLPLAVYMCVSLGAMYVLGRMSARSRGGKAYFTGWLSITLSLAQSYVLLRFLFGAL